MKDLFKSFFEKREKRKQIKLQKEQKEILKGMA